LPIDHIANRATSSLIFTKYHQDASILNADTNIRRRVWKGSPKHAWKDKFQAYMGLMDNELPRLMESSGKATTITRGSDLIAGAAIEEANEWIPQSTGLRYIMNIFHWSISTKGSLSSTSSNKHCQDQSKWQS